MPPKKKEVEEQPPVLGRFSSHLKMGIVGMPNVGKSSLFNCLSNTSNAAAENFPFCTIDPNSARVNLPDERYNWLCEHYKPKSRVPAFLEVVDIAGLVKGASEGKGLGNAFLSNIKQVDGIFHVLRAFDDSTVIHVEDRVDPIEDMQIISEELRAKDVEQLEKLYEQLNRRRGQLSREEGERLACCEKVLDFVKNEQKDIRHGIDKWNNKDIDFINSQQLLTTKPVVYLVNLTEKDYIRKKNKWLPKIKEWVDNHGKDPIIPFSAAMESQLLEMPEDERQNFLDERQTQSALSKIIRTGFHAIHLIYFFTVGEDEVRCWTIRKGMRAPQAAGQIHTDMEKGFICAEVMSFDALKEHGNEKDVKENGKQMQKGKDYVVQDGDILNVKFQRGGGGPKK